MRKENLPKIPEPTERKLKAELFPHKHTNKDTILYE